MIQESTVHDSLTPHTTPHCPGRKADLHLVGTRAAERYSDRSALETFVIVGGELSRGLGEEQSLEFTALSMRCADVCWRGVQPR